MDAAKSNYVLTYDLWIQSWIGLRITSEQILGSSYGPVYQTIINDIQQNNIGQLFDIDYLVSLTTQMRALLYHYSSKQSPFTIGAATTQFNPMTMIGSKSFVSSGRSANPFSRSANNKSTISLLKSISIPN